MTRLRRMARDTLAGDELELFDRLAGAERPAQKARFPRVGPDGALEGPFNALLLNPALGRSMAEVGAQVRYSSTLTDRCREIAILTVAAQADSAYEWAAHADIAHVVGLADAEIEALRSGQVPPDAGGTEAAVARAAHALVRGGDLDDELYAATVGALGERTLFELVSLIGYYQLIALQLRVFRVLPPAPPDGGNAPPC
jgi:alkylhydroperoxidase family enzyme